MNFSSDLRDLMAENGFLFNGDIKLSTGVYHTFNSQNGECKKNCCRYRIFEENLGANLICWRRGINIPLFIKSPKKLTLHEKEIHAIERQNIFNAKLEEYAKATKRCIKFLTSAIKYKNLAKCHPYVIRKNIIPYGAITCRQLLIILISDVHNEIRSIQFIKNDGFKLNKKGASLDGAMIWLWPDLPKNYNGVIRICEGWATGCTIREVTQSPVICALNAYNLPKVALLLRQKYPRALLKICADNDQWGKENIGIKCGDKASKMSGGTLHYPLFDNVDKKSKPTDWNDLFKLSTVKNFQQQIMLIRN